MRLGREESSILEQCPLFAGLSGGDLEAALAFFDARTQDFRKGEFLLRTGDRVSSFGLLLAGALQVCSDDLNGYRMIMASVTPGVLFGEALCYLQVQSSPIYITATEAGRVLWLRADGLLRPAADGPSSAMLTRYIGMLSAKLLQMNDRIQVLSRHLLRDKLTTYLSQCAAHSGNRSFTVPLDRESLASYLGVNRSALSRELSRMQREGLLRYEKNRFTLLW